jgi:type I restriction enzyme S subunit
LAEITAGPSGSLLDRLGNDPDGVPVVSPSNITDRHSVDTRSLRRLPQKDAEKLGRFILREGDLIVVRQGSLGRLAHVGPQREVWLYNSSCLRVRPRYQSLLPEYLTLYLSYPPVQEELLARAVSGTVPSMNSAILGELPIAVPSIERQGDIVEVISDVDELATVHRNMANHLETLGIAVLGDLLGAV